MRSTKYKYTKLGAVILVVGVVLSACGSSASSPTTSTSSTSNSAWAGTTSNAQAITALYNAAIHAGESQVVVYGSFSTGYSPLWAEFEKRFPGIKVVGDPIGGAPLSAKLTAEFSTGQHAADIILSGLTDVPADASLGWELGYKPVSYYGLPSRYIDSQNRYVIQFGDVYGILYNTNKMNTSQLPKTLQDLTKPEYKGMVMDAPLSGETTDLAMIELYRSGKLTPSLFKGILANATIVTSPVPYYAQLASGNVTMIPFASHFRYLTLKAAGAPVGFDAVPGMAVFAYGATAIVKHAPDLDAAKLFQSWFLTPEAQSGLVTAVSSYGLNSTAATPSSWPKLSSIIGALSPLNPAAYNTIRTNYETFVKQAGS